MLKRKVMFYVLLCVSTRLGAIVKGCTFCGFFLQHFLHRKLSLQSQPRRPLQIGVRKCYTGCENSAKPFYLSIKTNIMKHYLKKNIPFLYPLALVVMWQNRVSSEESVRMKCLTFNVENKNRSIFLVKPESDMTQLALCQENKTFHLKGEGVSMFSKFLYQSLL